VEIATIGFAGHSAESFFGRLRATGAEQLVDVRIHNVSQLAGFTKRDDLRFFVRELCNASYVHETLLAPTDELLKQYRSKVIGWTEYEKRFLDLMEQRGIERQLSRDFFATRTALLCSEHSPKQCHRRLVAEYLNDRWGDVRITHL
jgi:uncharacterized protein (DUF488 family)